MTTSFRKLSATAFVSDMGATLRQIAGYAFETVLPAGTVRQIAGYAFEQASPPLNLAVTGDLALYALINNNTTFAGKWSASNSTLGVPSVDNTQKNCNTKINLAALPVSGFGGNLNLFYNRRTLNSVISASISLGSIPSNTTVWAMLPTINTKYNINLTQTDVVNGTVLAGATTIALVAASTSWMFVPGSTVAVGLVASLSAVTPVTALSGFANASGVGPTSSPTVLLAHFDGANAQTTTVDATGLNTITLGPSTVLSSTQSKFGGTAVNIAGSTSVATVPDNARLRMTGDFTIEGWCFMTGVTADVMFMDKSLNATLANRAWFEFNARQILIKVDGTTTGAVAIGPSTGIPGANQWFHVAFVKQGTTWTCYINGQPIGTITSSATWGTVVGANLTIGNNYASAGAFPGFIDEVRITNGLARYTAAFTPQAKAFTLDFANTSLASAFTTTSLAMGVPSATTVRALINQIALIGGVNLLATDVVDGPVAAGATSLTLTVAPGCLTYPPGSTVALTFTGITNVLLHLDGTNGATTTTDAKGHAVTIAGSGTISTTQSKFGGSSYSPGTTGNLSVANSPAMPTPGDFTIEMFVYLNSMPSSAFFANRNTAGSVTTSFAIVSSFLQVGMDDGSAPLAVTASSWLTTGAWTHIAVSKQGTTLRLFVGGALASTITTSASWGNTANPLVIGSNGLGGNAVPGFVDEVRYSNMARYTAAFTPPAAPFTLD